MRGTYTHQEIMSQPDAWLEALKIFELQENEISAINPNEFEEVIFTGCGSTYYLAVAAAAVLQEATGVSAKGLPASEIWLYPRSAYNSKKRILLIAVSRSGATTETIRAVEEFKSQTTGKVLTLSCYPESELAQLGDLNLVLSSGQEKSVAQTRAFSTLYLGTVALTHIWSNQDISTLQPLVENGRQLLDNYDTLAKDLGTDMQLERFYFLGSGARYGLACELNLKLKEMTLSYSEPFHFLEFRHGPQSMVNENTLIIGLVSTEHKDFELSVLKEMKEKGAKVLALANTDADINFATDVPEASRNVLYLPIIQLLAYERSLGKGLDPDNPHNLTSVIVLENYA